MLSSDGTPTHIDWVLAQAATDGLTAIIPTLWQDTQPLMTDLLSLVHHTSHYQHAQVE